MNYIYCQNTAAGKRRLRLLDMLALALIAGAVALYLLRGGSEPTFGDLVEPGAGAGVASWTFEGVTPGWYRVSATWVHGPNRATNAQYRVLDGAAREEIHRLLLERHAVETKPRDLARAPYLWQPVERFYPEAMGHDQRAFYRSPWRSSRFCLVAGGRREVRLDLTLRLPPVPGAGERRGEVAVRVNGEAIATLRTGDSWSRSAAEIPQRILRPAINRLTLGWPTPPDVGEAARSEAGRRLEQGGKETAGQRSAGSAADDHDGQPGTAGHARSDDVCQVWKQRSQHRSLDATFDRSRR